MTFLANIIASQPASNVVYTDEAEKVREQARILNHRRAAADGEVKPKPFSGGFGEWDRKAA